MKNTPVKTRWSGTPLIATGVLLMAGMAGLALSAASQERSPRPASAAGPNDVATAREVLEMTARAYVAAPGLEDTMEVELRMPYGAPQRLHIQYAFGTQTNAYVRFDGIMNATALNDRLYVTRGGVDDKYLDTALDGDLRRSLRAIVDDGSNLPLPVAFDMRAERGIDAYLETLGMGLLRGARLVGHEKVTGDGGRPLHRLLLEGENGEGVVEIDAATSFLSGIELEASLPGRLPVNVSAVVRFEPKVPAAGKALIAFDPGDRKVVDSYRGLVPPGPIAVGDEAPDFTLRALDGSTVTLGDLRGKVVVLDFWALWCGPCKMALPHLQTFDDWVRSTDQPVVVLPIDTLEQAKTTEKMAAAAGRYWKSKGFTMPTLLDLDAAVIRAYRFNSIPTTVVVDAQGKVADIHQGFNPRMVETLKRNVQRLVASDG